MTSEQARRARSLLKLGHLTVCRELAITPHTLKTWEASINGPSARGIRRHREYYEYKGVRFSGDEVARLEAPSFDAEQKRVELQRAVAARAGSKTRLAEAAGMSRTTFVYLLSGKRRLTENAYRGIRAVLDLEAGGLAGKTARLSPSTSEVA